MDSIKLNIRFLTFRTETSGNLMQKFSVKFILKTRKIKANKNDRILFFFEFVDCIREKEKKTK